MLSIIQRLKQAAWLFFLAFFLAQPSFAQTSKIDDLLGQLNKSNPDTVQIKILRKLSAAYSAVDPVKKFYYANQFKLLAEKNGIDSVVANAYLDMGISYGIRSKLDSALYYFNLGFEKSKAINYVSGIARSHANIGYACDHLGRKKESVQHYEEALKIYRKLDLKRNINQLITNLGSIYFDLGEFKLADEYFRQVLENAKAIPNDEMGLANALFSLGNSNLKLGNAAQSLSYFQQSLAIRNKIGDLNGIALSNWGIGLWLNKKKQYQKALPHFEIALKNNRILKNVHNEAAVLIAYARAYLGLKDYKNAEEKAELALARAKESGSNIAVSDALEVLVDVNKEQKKYADALKFQTDYMAVSDSIDVAKTKKEVILTDLSRINADNKTLEKHNKTISSKNADYIVVISIITLLLAFLGILLLLYYKRNAENKAANMLLLSQKKEIAEVNEELGALNEELTTQMEIVSKQNIELEKLNAVKNKFFSIVSHDLRSPLATLKALFGLYRSGDLSESELNELLIKLEDTIYNTAAFLDNLLEWSKSQLEGMTVNPSLFNLHKTVDENIKLMNSQISLKSLQVENRIDPQILAYADPDMINTVIRNLLSNAIKFCDTADRVIFDASLQDDRVVISISDSGPGIREDDRKNLFNLSHTISNSASGEKGYHIGLILCKDMILQNKGNIQVDSTPGHGTTFIVSLPTAR